MTEKLRGVIAANLDTMTTDELLAIWIANDRGAWSDTAFEVIEAILADRGVELPEQNPPEPEEATLDSTEEDEEPEGEPVFYRPDEVFSLTRTISWLAPAALIITVIAGVPQWLELGRTISYYFAGSSLGQFLAVLITIPLGALLIGIQAALIFFALKALAAVLRILMEMEFNSRGAPPHWVAQDEVDALAPAE